MGLGIKIAAVLALLLAVVCGLGYWYYVTAEAQLATLRSNNAELSVAVQTNETTIRDLQAHAAQQQQLLSQLQNKMAAAEQGKQNTIALFTKKNLTVAGQQDYRALEDSINSYTQQSLDDLTTATGGRVTVPAATVQPPVKPGANHGQ